VLIEQKLCSYFVIDAFLAACQHFGGACASSFRADMMEALYSSETLAHKPNATRHNNPGDHHVCFFLPVWVTNFQRFGISLSGVYFKDFISTFALRD
jgi:hypothetical protein